MKLNFAVFALAILAILGFLSDPTLSDQTGHISFFKIIEFSGNNFWASTGGVIAVLWLVMANKSID